jgi:succinate-semialdehyde dehydrogenase/glutarate-semialdehyde dehydrogenase
MRTISSEQSVVDGVKKQLFVGGEWRDATGGATLAVEDPSTGQALCEVADAATSSSVGSRLRVCRRLSRASCAARIRERAERGRAGIRFRLQFS